MKVDGDLRQRRGGRSTTKGATSSSQTRYHIYESINKCNTEAESNAVPSGTRRGFDIHTETLGGLAARSSKGTSAGSAEENRQGDEEEEEEALLFDPLTRRIAWLVDFAGRCSKWKLFFAIILSRLPMLFIITVIWDTSVTDYDTSNLLLPTVFVHGYEDYFDITNDDGAADSSNNKIISNNDHIDALLLHRDAKTVEDPLHLMFERKEGDGGGDDLNYEASRSLQEDILGPMTPRSSSAPVSFVSLFPLTSFASPFFKGEPYRALRSLMNWDVIHFTHIAHYGYTHEHLHAFFPAVPALLWAWGRVARTLDEFVLEPIFDATMGLPDHVSSSGSLKSKNTCCGAFGGGGAFAHLNKAPHLIVIRNALRYLLEDIGAFILSLVAFGAAGVVLRSLTLLLLTYKHESTGVRRALVGKENDEEDEEEEKGSPEVNGAQTKDNEQARLLGIVMVTFITMPAGVFTLVPYTESLFALVVFSGIFLFTKATHASDEASLPLSSNLAPILQRKEKKQDGKYHNATSAISEDNSKVRSAAAVRYVFYSILSALCFALATLVRSNGIVLSGYFIHDLMFYRLQLEQKKRKQKSSEMKKFAMQASLRGDVDGVQGKRELPRTYYNRVSYRISFFKRFVLTAICVAITVSPYVAVNCIAWRDFCGGGGYAQHSGASNADATRRVTGGMAGTPLTDEEGGDDVKNSATTFPLAAAADVLGAYHLAAADDDARRDNSDGLLPTPIAFSISQQRDNGDDSVPPKCPSHWWGFYGYIQKKYWGVSPFGSYTLKNAPNFFIPAPVVIFVLIGLVRFWSSAKGGAGGDEEEEESKTMRHMRHDGHVMSAKPPAASENNTTTQSGVLSPAIATSGRQEVSSIQQKKDGLTKETTRRLSDSLSLSRVGDLLLVDAPQRLLPQRLLTVLVNPHVMCLLLMMLFAAVMMHIQVMVRFVFASPAYYWVATTLMRSPQRGGEGGGGGKLALWYLLCSVSWLIAGCFTFTNHYPWT